MKVINIEYISRLQKERHVLREKELLNELNHYHIVKLLHTFKDAEELYFVFEHLNGGTLDQLLQKCKFKLGEALVRNMFAQLVNLIDYLQQHEVMHRDLKPGNIMIDSFFNIKVIDFGDAKKEEKAPPEKVEEAPKVKNTSSNDKSTEEGGDFAFEDDYNDEQDDSEDSMYDERVDSFVGTVNYQSPEVIKGANQTLAVDIWALGNILFKMLTGKVPFKGTIPMQVYDDICKRNI